MERAAALVAVSGGTEETVIVMANRVAVYGLPGLLDRVGDVLAEARRTVDREGSLALTEPYFDFWEAVIGEWQGRLDRGRDAPLGAHRPERGGADDAQ